MDWYIEVFVILTPAIVAWQYLRPHVKPIKRLMTWLVLFFACYYFVDYLNGLIFANEWLPAAWGHLPLQAIATMILVLFIPIREKDSKPQPEDDSKSAIPFFGRRRSEEPSPPTRQPAKKRFKKR